MLGGTENKDKPIWVDFVYRVHQSALGTAEQNRPRLVSMGLSWTEVTVSYRVRVGG